MFVELGYLAGGIIPGRLLKNSPKAHKASSFATTCSIYALLFILGAQLGGDDKLFSAIGALGLQAITISACCIFGSILCVLPVQRWFEPANKINKADAGNFLKSFVGSIYILCFFCLGLLLGKLGLLPSWMFASHASLYILWLMLFFVGMGMGFNLSSLLIVRDLGLRVAMVPALVVLGTGLGALIAAFVLPAFSLKETAAVGAGFGYYSLSSVLISNHGLVALGSIALISNIFRELFTLLFTPILARALGPLTPIASAGSTSMDTCLPIIVRFTAEHYGVIAVFNGLVMTILVPIIVSSILTFF